LNTLKSEISEFPVVLNTLKSEISEFPVVLNTLKSEISELPVVLNTTLVSMETGREQQRVLVSRSLLSPSFPLVRLTRKRGHSLPPDGETQVVLHLPQAQIHVVLMTRESEIFLDIKIDTTSS
jgi:hypothetical protein